MKLEDIRFDDSYKHYIEINSNRIFLTYNDFVHVCFYNTLDQLSRLENSKQTINQGIGINSIISSWFIAIESYINSLLRVACSIDKKYKFNDLLKKQISPRITILCEILNLDPKLFHQTIGPQLDEFKCYRNEIFHDRSGSKEINFSKTKFSSNPLFANQIDLIQATIISLEVFKIFENIFPGFSVIPRTFIATNSGDKKIHELSILSGYEELIKPLFKLSLYKHLLSTSISLDLSGNSYRTSNCIDIKDIKLLQFPLNSKSLEIKPTENETTFGEDLFKKLKSNVIAHSNNSRNKNT